MVRPAQPWYSSFTEPKLAIRRRHFGAEGFQVKLHTPQQQCAVAQGHDDPPSAQAVASSSGGRSAMARER